MKTLTEAVKACGGVWPGRDESHDHLFTTGAGLTAQGYNGSDFKVAREDGYINILCSLKLGYGGWTPLGTRPEFEAEADRLSGKPGWGEAPEGYNWRWQNADGGWKFGKGPEPREKDNYYVTDYHTADIPGTVLGDWRDTLERRPEAKAEAEYRPPVSGVCEVYLNGKWEKCMILAADGDARWLKVLNVGYFTSDSLYTFRPLKSDRERWCEQACEVTGKPPTPGDLIEEIYDALKSGELPMPE